MLQLTVAVYFPDGCVQEFFSVRLLHGLVKIYGVWVRAGQVNKGVLHVFLYLVVVLVHCLIVSLIVVFLLHCTEHLIREQESLNWNEVFSAVQ